MQLKDKQPMKIIKPLRLSVLNRPYRWQGKNYLGVSVLALADMGPEPRLRPEVELWQLTTCELQTSGGVIDMAIPKARAEFLATGYAYTNHQQKKNACIARIEIAELSKSLVVFGDRYWSGSKITPPQSFEQMRVDWSRAYGGEGCEENPHGIGFSPERQQVHGLRRLPNLESPAKRITSPKQKLEPVSFGPLDIQWPGRFNLMGKKYDSRWLQNDFPGFARDTDWKVFNAASSDQCWNDRDALPPQANWRIWNMHPEKPLQEGRLPPWHARCFINRQRGEEMLFEEIALRATTVWFFPHLEQMILIWQGCIRINEDDAADVLHLIPAIEKMGAPRTVKHYQHVLTQRLDKEKGALLSFREKELLPEDLIGSWIDTEVEQTPGPLQDIMKKRAQLLRDRHRTRIEACGGDIHDLSCDIDKMEPLKLESLPEFIEKMEYQGQVKLAELEQRRQTISKEYTHLDTVENLPRGPESIHHILGILNDNQQGLSEKKLKSTRESLNQMYLAAVQHQPPAVRLKGDLAEILRQRAKRTLSEGGDFSGMDLTGVDFSGMDLRGARFNNALLECADLSNCQLDGVSFQSAVLARASLLKSSLRGCDFSKASLALTQSRSSDFSGALFVDTQLQNAIFEECIFDNAVLKELMLREISLIRCRFNHTRIDSCIFMELILAEADFSNAQLFKTSFMQSVIEGAVFSKATLENCALIQTQADGTRFDGATWIATAVVSQSTLNRADFSLATLKQSNLRQTSLVGTQFNEAKIENSDLSEADCSNATFVRANLAGSLFVRTDFQHADFSDANLMTALLQKSHLGGCNFSGANLFRADLSQSLISKSTNLEGAWLKRLKTLPKIDGELI